MTAVRIHNLSRPKPRILITGGCGFIGSNVAHALAARGEQVIALDAMVRKGAQENACWLKTRWRDRVEVMTLDVRDRDAICSVVAECRAVLHLAGQVAVTSSLDDPMEDFSINTLGTLNLLECLRQHNPAAPLIFASTNKVYGRVTRDDELARHGARYEPSAERLLRGVSETAPLDLCSPYGCSKGAADQYAHDYARVFGLRTVVLRMSCIYGYRQFGTEDQGWLAHFMIKTLRHEPITIYGDGYQVRDVLFIDDAVNAWLTTLERIDTVSGRVFNLGGGPKNSLSLVEAIDCIGKLCGRRPRLEFAAWRPGDQPWYVSDIGAISGAMDWLPRIAPAEGLQRLEDWVFSRFADLASGAEVHGAAV
jgi:CDP-paratose 2-epimerase